MYIEYILPNHTYFCANTVLCTVVHSPHSSCLLRFCISLNLKPKYLLKEHQAEAEEEEEEEDEKVIIMICCCVAGSKINRSENGSERITPSLLLL